MVSRSEMLKQNRKRSNDFKMKDNSNNYNSRDKSNNYNSRDNSNRYSQKSDNSNIDNIIDEINQLEMLKDLKPKDYADIDGIADKVAKEFSGRNNKLNTNQLRKFFGAVRDIERKNTWIKIEPEIYLLKPKLAVSVGRKLIPKKFFEFMNTCMNKIDVGESDEDKMENFKTFVKLFEAIVAYHKYYTN